MSRKEKKHDVHMGGKGIVIILSWNIHNIHNPSNPYDCNPYDTYVFSFNESMCIIKTNGVKKTPSNSSHIQVPIKS